MAANLAVKFFTVYLMTMTMTMTIKTTLAINTVKFEAN